MSQIHCWNFSSYENVPEEYKKHHLWFAGDMPNGSYLLECGYCGKEFECPADLQNCPHCNKDLIFPRTDW